MIIISVDCRVDSDMRRTLSDHFIRKSSSLVHIQQTQLSIPPRNQSWRLFRSHICFATPSLMVEEKREIFDTERANLLVNDTRKIFNTGKTKSYERRVSQLTGILRMIEEKEVDIVRALYQDLSKPELEAFISEVQYFFLKLREYVL